MMDKGKFFALRAMATVAILTASLYSRAAEVVYRIVEYNKTTQEFTLAASGEVPEEAWAYFENDYGATTGNRYNQIPRNRKATLYLAGWQGCTIKSLTLNMCSNNKSGQVGLTVTDGDTEIYRQSAVDFADERWFGQWVSKDLNTFVDITKEIPQQQLTSDEACITLSGGTSEGSVYVNSITIEYDAAPGSTLESPLGWTYSKLTKKSTLATGDEVMIYRNGSAATDIDGMETSHYLDAIAVASTSDVDNHSVLRFTLDKDDAHNLWTLTDQFGRKLGATGKQQLAWDNGNTLWQIDLGYDGATITSSNANYGTMRYNAPDGSYARFNIYTSTSLPLPFLYIKESQRQPVRSTSLTFGEQELTANVKDGNIALCPTLLPTATTDKRITWSSSDENVATVNGGFVTLYKVGQTIITARAKDGGAQASVTLNIADTSGIGATTTANRECHTVKVADGNKVVIINGDKSFAIDGSRLW